MIEKNQKSGHGEKKSRKKEMAVIALLTEPTVGQAAQKVGIGEATMWRWMQDGDFKEMYRMAKVQAVGQAIARIQQVTTQAVDTLYDVMTSKKAPAMARVIASKTVLEVAMKAVEVEDIQARLEALERAAGHA